MGLFGRDDRPSQGSAPPAPGNPHPHPASAPSSRAGAALTVIANGCVFEGKITGRGDIHVEGELRGEVSSSATVIVAEGGRALARLHAQAVIVAGAVEGDVSADERIELKPSADLRGNITAPRILIHDGATFEGQVDMKAPAREPAGGKARKPADAPQPGAPGKGGRSV